MLPTSATSLFCEDIRTEQSGMNTLIGVFPDNVNVPSFPYAFPKMGVYSRIVMDVNSAPKGITLSISAPGIQDPFSNELSHDWVEEQLARNLEKGSQVLGLVNRLIASPFVIHEPTTVQSIIKIGRKKYLGGIINLKLASDDEVSGPTA